MTGASKNAALILYRASSEIAGRLAMLAVTVVAARRLSQESFGIFSLASAFGTLVGLATDFGIPMHVARAVAQRPADASQILRRWLRVRIGTAVIVTVLVFVGVLAMPSKTYAVAILLFALAYILTALVDFLHYFYRGMGRSDVESSLKLWQRSTMVGAGLLALWWTTNLNVLAAATVLPALATFVFSVWFARRLARQAERGVERHDQQSLPSLWTEFKRDVLPIGAGILLSTLYFRIDLFLIEHWKGTEAVALYNAALRLLEGVRLLPAAVMAVVLPSLCQATDMGPFRRVSAGLTLFGTALAIVAWTSAGWLVPRVYGSTYAEATQAFRILMLSFPLMSLNYVTTQQLIGWHGQRAYAVVCGLALVLNVGLNAWLVPAYSLEGAAWATLGTEVLVAIGCAWGLRARSSALPPDATEMTLANAEVGA